MARLVNHLWDKNRRTFKTVTLPFDRLREVAWKNKYVTDGTIRSAISRLGTWFSDMGIGFQVRTTQQYLVVEPT